MLEKHSQAMELELNVQQELSTCYQPSPLLETAKHVRQPKCIDMGDLTLGLSLDIGGVQTLQTTSLAACLHLLVWAMNQPTTIVWEHVFLVIKAICVQIVR